MLLHEIALLIPGSIIQVRVVPFLQIMLDLFVIEVEAFDPLINGIPEPLCSFDESLLVGTEGLSRIAKIAQQGARKATLMNHSLLDIACSPPVIGGEISVRNLPL